MSDFTRLLHDSSKVSSHATGIKGLAGGFVNLHPRNSCCGWHLNGERCRDKIMLIVAAYDKNGGGLGEALQCYL